MADLSGWRRLWRRHGPTLRWNTFRLHGEPPNGSWMPIRITQLVGGKSWSLSLTRIGAPITEPQEDR